MWGQAFAPSFHLTANRQFGSAVALDKGLAMVGCSDCASGGTVTVFTSSDMHNPAVAWVNAATLALPGGPESGWGAGHADSFGVSVAVRARVAVVGSNNAGVYLFIGNAASPPTSWDAGTKLVPPPADVPGPEKWLFRAVAVSADVVVGSMTNGLQGRVCVWTPANGSDVTAGWVWRQTLVRAWFGRASPREPLPAASRFHPGNAPTE